jgi:hypothetical protein
VKIIYRCMMTVTSCVLWSLCVVYRRNIVRDEVAKVDPYPISGLAFVAMSFFADFSLRSAFRTKSQLRKMQKEATGRLAAMTASAMEIMLPRFVTDRIVAVAIEAKEEATASEGGSIRTGTGSNYESAVTDIDFNDISATWEYPHVVVLFAKFCATDVGLSTEAINMTVQMMELVMQRHGVRKVKTIGSTMMCVVGIDDPRSRQDQLSAIVDAARVVRFSVFHKMNAEHPKLTHAIGIHCGPCFGAVFGGNGCIFDIFGDTVNTASRMLSTAGDRTIQLSTAAHALLEQRLRGDVVSLSPVTVKGKGLMDVYGIMVESPSNESVSAFSLDSDAADSPAFQRSSATNGVVDKWRQTWAHTVSPSPHLNETEEFLLSPV